MYRISFQAKQRFRNDRLLYLAGTPLAIEDLIQFQLSRDHGQDHGQDRAERIQRFRCQK